MQDIVDLIVITCDRCSNASCERFDGKCTYGCTDGFTGHRCHIPGKVRSHSDLILFDDLLCLTTLSATFQLYHSDQF